ncbi:MAG: hypothetical protein OEY01_10705 [Desulfobulbaceae bacterium]|nr:hypothetical protein [Desulfobulbaceae bacterium]
MKALLAAIKQELQANLTGIRDSDIYITPHENYIPATAKPPCVGIKDGGENRVELVADMWEVTAKVIIVPYVQLYKAEASIMGDAVAGKKGVLEMTAEIHAVLDRNHLNISGMQWAFSSSETPSQLFGDQKQSLQRQLITYQYVYEEERP